jgi:hypothetical protein
MEMHVVEGKHTYSSSFLKEQGKVERFIAAKLAWDDQMEACGLESTREILLVDMSQSIVFTECIFMLELKRA